MVLKQGLFLRHRFAIAILLLGLALLLAACGGGEEPEPTAAAPDSSIEGRWQPQLNTSWQWQLNDLPIDMSVDVAMYDIDLFDNDAATVATLHQQGRKVVCYVNAGGWESWRPDAAKFPGETIEANLDDWEGERWLDIRRIDVLGPIMEVRIDLCHGKGFDGIEPDNVDGFLNNTGFPLTYQDQLRYNIWLADAAHWALNEQCFEYDECDTLLPFIEAGKPVLNVEYKLEPGEFCPKAMALGFNSIQKKRELDAWRDVCFRR